MQIQCQGTLGAFPTPSVTCHPHTLTASPHSAISTLREPPATLPRSAAEPRYVEAASNAAEFLLSAHRQTDGTLWRTSRDGGTIGLAYGVDLIAFSVRADLAQVRGGICFHIDMDPRWVIKLMKRGWMEVLDAYKAHVIDQWLLRTRRRAGDDAHAPRALLDVNPVVRRGGNQSWPCAPQSRSVRR